MDSRLFLGAKAAVSGAPSSWEVQSDCAELLHTKPQLHRPGGRTCREQGHFGHLLSPPAITFQGAKTLEEVLILSADPTGFLTRSKEPVGDPQTGNLPLPGKSRHWEAPVGVGGSGCVMNLLWFRAPGWNSPLSWHFPLSSAFPEAASVVKKGN